MIERTCRNKKCGAKFVARTADVKRGWGMFCSKSCKANSPKVGHGQRAYSRLAAPHPAPSPRRTPTAQQISMYELGTVEWPAWDDRAWQAAG